MSYSNYLTVTALTTYLKVKLENDPHLKKILLKGEISNFKRHSTGHLYFSLKDEKSSINSMMFSSYTKSLLFEPKDGDHVLVEGYISLYEARGTYSISITSMTLDGVGELYLKYEQLKKDFEALGYFDSKYKKPIPKFPKAIGVITSETGAVIQDIKTTISRRYLLTKIILYPALVQGEGSKDSLVRQIKRANEEAIVDTLIIGRGGGSIEDLWSFNEPEVITAIFESKIPVITAIGHETDTTLSDFVSDLRAPTPTAAAELATPNINDLLINIKEKEQQLNYYINERLKNIKLQLMNLDERLVISSPKAKLKTIHDRVSDLSYLLNKNYKNKLTQYEYQVLVLKNKLISPKDKIHNIEQKIMLLEKALSSNYQHKVSRLESDFKSLTSKLNALNPLNIMERGFSLTTKNQKVITSIKELNKDDVIEVDFKDGSVESKVIQIKERNLKWMKN